MMKKNPSLIGGACIIASVCVGAGMLGLPSAGAGAWTIWSMLAIAITMVVMTISGWMLLEAFKHYELKVSFDTVTKDLLGDKINLINNITVYFVGGILLYAYITSSGLILQDVLGLNAKIASVLFVLIFSAFCLAFNPCGRPNFGCANCFHDSKLCVWCIGLGCESKYGGTFRYH